MRLHKHIIHKHNIIVFLMLRLDGLSLIFIIPVYLQYMASYASKPLYIDRVTYISNVSIAKGNLYCATCPAQLSNDPTPIV